MRMNTATTKTPWHLWVVGFVSLLWNSFGANDFTQSQLRNRDYLAAMSEGMGVTADQMIAYIDSFPMWATVLWAMGVWGALIGSVLLLLRMRYAVSAFAVSLLGLAGSTLYQLVTPQPDWTQNSTGMMMQLLIWTIAIVLLLYAWRMRQRGVLR